MGRSPQEGCEDIEGTGECDIQGKSKGFYMCVSNCSLLLPEEGL